MAIDLAQMLSMRWARTETKARLWGHVRRKRASGPTNGEMRQPTPTQKERHPSDVAPPHYHHHTTEGV
jgi:hypothetical protein